VREGFSIPPQCPKERSRELLQTAGTRDAFASVLKKHSASLLLEDGTIFNGYSFGAPGGTDGEAVFSTGMVGYPEALTDPSYRGQILALTYPLIGNYGVPDYQVTADGFPAFFESEHVQVRGLVVHEACDVPSHHQSVRNLDEWLREEGIPAICGIDTRRLARVLRERGVMLAAIQPSGILPAMNCSELTNPNLRDLVAEVSVNKTITYHPERSKRIVLLDCGVKLSVIRSLLKRGVAVVRMPYNSTASEVLAENPAGIVVSNGPGDPKICTQAVRAVHDLIETSVPMLGICLGNQLIALATGADTYKMKYGHRSQNQPVVNSETGRCYITTQNHGFAIDRVSLERSGLQVWFVNANDQSIEGIRLPKKPCWGVQWHPEASPGPTDTEFIFDLFLKGVAEHAS
jgi:carbamoyl-phosphate synthase small subunit